MGTALSETYEKRNPWRPSQVTGVFPASGAAEARAAIDAAHEAFPAWLRLPAGERAVIFGRAAGALEARVEQIAQDMTAEMGKPLRETRLEAARAAAILRFAAGEAFRPVGEVYEPSVSNQTLYTLRRPLGVVGLITPWNFPAAIPVWKLAPALVYGNTVVLKLAYDAPKTGLHHSPAPSWSAVLCANAPLRGTAAFSSSSVGTTRCSCWPTPSSTAPLKRRLPERSGRPGRSARRPVASTCTTRSTTTSARASSRASRPERSATRPIPPPR